MNIDHINIVVSDLDEATRFYELLGFEVVHKDLLEGGWISRIVGLPDVRAKYVKMSFPDAQTSLELMQYYEPVGSKDSRISLPHQIGFRHMALKVSNIHEIVEHLKQEGVEFFSEIQDYPPTGKKLVYFLGPDGVVLELAEYNERGTF